MHRDIVSGPQPGIDGLASTDLCENQGMYEKGRLITVQGHPEFTSEIMEEILNTRVKLGILTPEVFNDGMNRLEDHDDGVIVGQAFLRFLLED
jgi:GMP synthase-like glutamine amidotransferase